MMSRLEESEEWKQQRLGKVTASRIKDILPSKKTGKYLMSRENYLFELLQERLTQEPITTYSSPEMDWGREMEGQAKSHISFINEIEISPAQFVPHPTIKDAGATPDGYITEDKLIEIKCLKTKNHLQVLSGNKSFQEFHSPQVMWQLECTQTKECELFFFDPRLPFDLQTYSVTIVYDKEYAQLLKDEVRKFLHDLNELEIKIKKMGE